MDTHQAIYDAVRSKISNGDIGQAVENAIRSESLGHYVQQAMYQFEIAATEMQRPSVIFHPVLSKDGNLWCALLGSDVIVGIAGFGETPDKAMRAFDEAFTKKG